jgi:hypothetical protein
MEANLYTDSFYITVDLSDKRNCRLMVDENIVDDIYLVTSDSVIVNKLQINGRRLWTQLQGKLNKIDLDTVAFAIKNYKRSER